ncbi:MAG: hypothetical protein QOI21_406 [Actinomycetota bacterium]|nr:hypothetical protein [Actinomycetota bacterium]
MEQMGNEWAVDASELGWLQKRLANSLGDGVHMVSEIVPPGFDSYVRVFHSWFAEDDEGRRTTWREQAERCGVSYTSDMTVRALVPSLGPPLSAVRWLIDEGEPDSRSRGALVEILAGVTGEQPVFFSYELAVLASGGDGPIVVRATLSELESIRARLLSAHPGIAGPEHWWPEDRSWVVGSDYDLCSTYVACSEEVGRRFLIDDGLEALPLAPNARVDERRQ